MDGHRIITNDNTYHASSGKLVSLTAPDGTVLSYSYDNDGLLIQAGQVMGDPDHSCGEPSVSNAGNGVKVMGSGLA